MQSFLRGGVTTGNASQNIFGRDLTDLQRLYAKKVVLSISFAVGYNSAAVVCIKEHKEYSTYPG